MLELVLTYSYSAIDSLLLLRYKLEVVTSAWNDVATADANKLERIRRKPAALCVGPFIPLYPPPLCLRI